MRMFMPRPYLHLYLHLRLCIYHKFACKHISNQWEHTAPRGSRETKRRKRRRGGRGRGEEGRATTTKERRSISSFTISHGRVLNTVPTESSTRPPGPVDPPLAALPEPSFPANQVHEAAPGQEAQPATQSSLCLRGDSGRQPTAPGEETIKERDTPPSQPQAAQQHD